MSGERSAAFNSLTVGASFDKRRFAPKQPAAAGGRPAAPAAAAPLGAAPGEATSAALPSRPALPSMAMFGKPPRRKTGEEDAVAAAAGSDAESAASATSGGGAAGGAAGAADEEAGRPLKPLSGTRHHHLLKRHGLQLAGGDPPRLVEHFSELVRPPHRVSPVVVDNLFARDHRVPTPVQMVALPALLQRRDVLACAPTGSGKTVAFLVPLFAQLGAADRAAGVRALVVAPTKELAVQIEREAFFLAKGGRWRFVAHGQTTKDKDLMVTTPQRAVSMAQAGHIDFGRVQYLVFDEGDKLWDSTNDNLQQVDALVGLCAAADKTVALFSATLSARVEQLARSVMGADPLRVIVQGRTAASKAVQQRLVFCGTELGKIVEVRNLAREGLRPPVLVFVQSVERSRELFEEIRSSGLRVGLMHAKMSGEERDAAVLNFRMGRTWVLICTELMARGIDFKNVGTVINFDLPLTPESYVHRVGRTGRAGREGLAITFFTEEDFPRLPPIARLVREAGWPVDDWVLAMKVDRRATRRLQRAAPTRMVVSSRKRALIGEQRLERQMRAIEKSRGKVAAANGKGKRPRDDDDEDGGGWLSGDASSDGIM